MIPTNKTITVTKKAYLDNWGKPVAGESVSYNCLLTFRTEKTIDNDGNEVVSTVNLMFNGFVNIDYGDVISWTEENGELIKVKPLNISFKRDLGGKTLITKVVV